MRSESLIRLDDDGLLVSASAAAARQAELDRQKAEYFARGGQIEKVAGHVSRDNTIQFNQDLVLDYRTNKIVTRPIRERVGDRWLVPARRAAYLAGRSGASIHGLVRRGKFPKPVASGPARWDEQEVIEWAKQNPNPRHKNLHDKL